jgi:hypothetical protein
MPLAMIAVILLVVVAAGAMLSPLWHARQARAHGEDPTSLEIARDAKLGELDDLELDFQLGKLSSEDFRLLGATLRGEAIQIIRQIDAGGSDGGSPRKTDS